MNPEEASPRATPPEATPGDKKGHPAALSADQEKALAALLTSRTIEAAAKKAGVSDRTLHRWLNEPAFRQAYLSARRMAMEQATSVLQRAASSAVTALQKNLSCGTPSAEIAAAKAILDMGFRAVEVQEFEARLAALEEALTP